LIETEGIGLIRLNRVNQPHPLGTLFSPWYSVYKGKPVKTKKVIVNISRIIEKK